jgi:hypothetical protein
VVRSLVYQPSGPGFDSWQGIRTWDLWVSVLIESYRRAIAGGTLEFPGQLIASLLVAQWSERWCASLVAQGLIPGMSRSESAITRGKPQMMLLPPTSFSCFFLTQAVLQYVEDSPERHIVIAQP